jgi:mono/diheme cytochrome c family protein
MKRTLKWIGGTLATLVAVGLGTAGYIALAGMPRYRTEKVAFSVDVTPERVARGKRHAEMLCAGCHLDPATGALTGKRMADVPVEFGAAYSRNITKHPEKGIGTWTDAEIAYLLRTGVARDGRYTPPWMVKLPHMSDEEMKDIIAFLRSDDPLVRPLDVPSRDSEPTFLTKFLSRVAFKPYPYPSAPVPPPNEKDPVAFGRYLVTARYGCFGCHSADFKTLDELRPERTGGYLGGGNAMRDRKGEVIHTANLTPDAETGIGTWTEAQFRRALVDGIRPDNRPLLYPMEPVRGLRDDEVSAIYAYLRTVPPIRNAVPRAGAAAAPASVSVSAPADRGKAAYYKYACNSCHGDAGIGAYDLRKGARDYPTDEALIGFIRHPERDRPGTRMPTWDGVIPEDELPALAAYVRALGEAAR